jgi:hypothetical protein
MKLKRLLAVVAAIALALVLISWPVRWMVTGQVVDAETDEPIENAVATIMWTEPGPGPPGLRGTVATERAEDVSDARGRFRLPKFSSLLGVQEFRMAVYKKGYICWNSAFIFPSKERRTGFIPGDGMIIRLEPLKEQHSRELHAVFTCDTEAVAGTRRFTDATKEERRLCGEWARKNREK